MSNSLAIAAVTASLRNLLSQTAYPLPGEPSPDLLSDVVVSTKTPDKARSSDQYNQLNLFLYQTLPNAAFRNRDMPGRGRSGEESPQPLALNLHYLLTAYGGTSDDILAHRLLGRAMSLLHDRPVLASADIEAALPGTDLHLQVERVYLTPISLTWEEMSKLWSTLQTPYRLSVAYEASVVLIDAQRPTRAAPPVLSLGGLEHGVWPEPRLSPPFPALTALVLPRGQPGARLEAPNAPADILTVGGQHLSGAHLSARITSPLLPAPITLEALPGRTGTAFRVELTGPASRWHAGTFTLSAVVGQDNGPDAVTQGLPFVLVPRLLSIQVAPSGDALTVTCTPPIWPRQRATLLLGEEELPAAPHPTLTDTLTFPLETPRPGTHWVRLRVDGVDSLLVDYAATPPAFDPSQKVTLP
ncbi:MAG: DUF4255 domain-containing protein [Myxococcaceae bacterium]|nr:DUF4255 domain-containing protein [Myxococcaceae bacterium]